MHQTPKSMLADKVPMQVVIKLGEELNLVERKARELFAAGQTRQALLKWRDMCLLAESFVKHPSKMFIIVRKQIQICLWKLYGARIARELENTWHKENQLIFISTQNIDCKKCNKTAIHILRYGSVNT